MYDQQRDAEALAEFDAVLKTTDEWWPHVVRAFCLIYLGRVSEAKEVSLRMQQISDTPDLSTEQAALEVTWGDYTSADARLRRAIAMAPDSPRSHLLLVFVMALKANFAEAEAACVDALEHFPEDANLWEMRGDLAFHRSDIAEALRSLDKQAQFANDLLSNWLDRVVVLRHLGRGDDADQCLREAERLMDADRSSWSRAAYAAVSGKIPEALKLLERAIRRECYLYDAARFSIPLSLLPLEWK